MVRRTVKEIAKAVDQAREMNHDYRAMRVTMECGHIRLMPYIDSISGIGTHTECHLCNRARQIVNVEETGTIHESWVSGDRA